MKHFKRQGLKQDQAFLLLLAGKITSDGPRIIEQYLSIMLLLSDNEPLLASVLLSLFTQNKGPFGDDFLSGKAVISRDEAPGEERCIIGSNWYGYCSNNPLGYVDPTGLIGEYTFSSGLWGLAAGLLKSIALELEYQKNDGFLNTIGRMAKVTGIGGLKGFFAGAGTELGVAIGAKIAGIPGAVGGGVVGGSTFSAIGGAMESTYIQELYTGTVDNNIVVKDAITDGAWGAIGGLGHTLENGGRALAATYSTISRNLAPKMGGVGFNVRLATSASMNAARKVNQMNVVADTGLILGGVSDAASMASSLGVKGSTSPKLEGPAKYYYNEHIRQERTK